MPVGLAPLFSHTAIATTTVVIIWDVSLCLYFLYVIEDTVSFKFRGVYVGLRVGLVLYIYFYLYMFLACFRYAFRLF